MPNLFPQKQPDADDDDDEDDDEMDEAIVAPTSAVADASKQPMDTDDNPF
jgi:hypothetical protein